MSEYDSWTNADFTHEYAAAIDRMMTPSVEKTVTTFGGQTYTYWASGNTLDLPVAFFEAWRKLWNR